MRWTKLFVATTNAGKLRDFAAAAREFNVTLEPLPGLEDFPEALEDRTTFLENAIQKSEHYSALARGYDVLADDSGLEVDALGGVPGVRSARFAADAGFRGSGTPEQQNNLLLLEQLNCEPVPRVARFCCALAVARDGRCVATAEGFVDGEITLTSRGEGGFGYDPLFLITELARTMAELDPAEKQRHSHRGNALRKLLAKD